MSDFKKRICVFIAKLLGCLCFGGDWLMMYGDPTYAGKLKWLTIGTVAIGSTEVEINDV